MNTTIISYTVDAANDCVHTSLRHDDGTTESFVFRESQYLPGSNWTDDDLCKAVIAAHADVATANLAVATAEQNTASAAAYAATNQRLSDAKVANAAALNNIGLPPVSALPDIAACDAAIDAEQERLRAIHAAKDAIIAAQKAADDAAAQIERERLNKLAAAQREVDKQELVKAVMAELQVQGWTPPVAETAAAPTA